MWQHSSWTLQKSSAQPLKHISKPSFFTESACSVVCYCIEKMNGDDFNQSKSISVIPFILKLWITTQMLQEQVLCLSNYQIFMSKFSNSVAKWVWGKTVNAKPIHHKWTTMIDPYYISTLAAMLPVNKWDCFVLFVEPLISALINQLNWKHVVLKREIISVISCKIQRLLGFPAPLAIFGKRLAECFLYGPKEGPLEPGQGWWRSVCFLEHCTFSKAI